MGCCVPNKEAIITCLETWQEQWCAAFETFEPIARFGHDPWEHGEGGGGLTRVMEGGNVIERGGINVSRVRGSALPETATRLRPECAGRPFEAMGISLVVHPRNPHAPTVHANLRFIALEDGPWWFGGGWDLTPHYGYVEDAVHWHEQAKAACKGFGEETYTRCKVACDAYFYLKHRGHCRGVGGLFFDDWKESGFEHSFAFVRQVGTHFLPAYLPILQRRCQTPYGEAERAWQALRRGRYVEFNLVYDRGTHFGLQSRGRADSILVSMPPVASWAYTPEIARGSPEARLEAEFLQPRDWLGENS